MNPQSTVIFWLAFSLFMIASFIVFPIKGETEALPIILTLVGRSFFAWVTGKLAVSYFEDD